MALGVAKPVMVTSSLVRPACCAASSWPNWENVQPDNYYSEQDAEKSVTIGKAVLAAHADIDLITPAASTVEMQMASTPLEMASLMHCTWSATVALDGGMKT